MGSRQTKAEVINRHSLKQPIPLQVRQGECYLNPDPLVRLIGRANESEIAIDDTKLFGIN